MITLPDLYEEYESGLSRFALNLTHDADQADDMVSDTFFRALSHLVLLEQLNPFQRKAWLYRVLKNRFIDEQRAHRREKVLIEQMAWANALAMPSAFSREIFAQVPERFKELLSMHYILEMTSEEIGARLGIPAATVRSRLHLAIQWLKSHPPQI
jgi:RNA polymerase sigma-70 factor, ECF subfamily